MWIEIDFPREIEKNDKSDGNFSHEIIKIWKKKQKYNLEIESSVIFISKIDIFMGDFDKTKRMNIINDADLCCHKDWENFFLFSPSS